MTDKYLRAAKACSDRGDYDGAFTLLSAELNERPERPEALYLMGHILRARGDLGVALHLLGKALAYEQKQPNLWMSYGATLHDLHRHEEAIEAFGVVAKMLPNDAMPPANTSAALVNMGRWRECIEAAEIAQKSDPENYIAKISRTFAELALGRWKDAWKNADYLYGNHLTVRVYCDPEEPAWDGTKGQTVVVTCDQGIGDQIMFAQCLPEMAKDCKEVIVECSPRMEGFFRRNFPMCTVYGTLKDKTGLQWPKQHAIDAHIHISHLGKFYRNRNEDFPRKPYAVPRPDLVEKWTGWLSQFPKPWIGVSWKGGIQSTQKHLRSIDLADLAPVLNVPATFIDLSYMDNNAEVAAWNLDNDGQVIRPPIDTTDYDDTIALAAALDEIVTVTTSLVHVCGSIGRTALVLVPAVAQWRYAYHYGDGKHMIWYDDGVTMYRQRGGEQWLMPINRVAKDLMAKYGRVRKAA